MNTAEIMADLHSVQNLTALFQDYLKKQSLVGLKLTAVHPL